MLRNKLCKKCKLELLIMWLKKVIDGFKLIKILIGYFKYWKYIKFCFVKCFVIFNLI